MNLTLSELYNAMNTGKENSGDISFYGVVNDEIRDGNIVTAYLVEVGDSIVEARKMAGANVGDIVLCTTLNNGVTVVTGALNGDKDAASAIDTAESVEYRANQGDFDGVSITNVRTYYLATSASSGVSVATAGWTTSPQNITTTNKYLWIYQEFVLSEGNSILTTPCIHGVYGNTGPQGPATTISTQSTYYASSSSGTTIPSTGWQTTIPTVSQGNYLWTRTGLVFSDNTTVYIYTNSYQAIDGSGGGSSSSYIEDIGSLVKYYSGLNHPNGSVNVALKGTTIIGNNKNIAGFYTTENAILADGTTGEGTYIYLHGSRLSGAGIGHKSLTSGSSNQAAGFAAQGFGDHVKANYNCQAAFGKYNDNKSTNIFEIGIGSGTSGATDERKNALEVSTSGDLIVCGDITAGGDLDVTGDADVGSLTIDGHSSPIGTIVNCAGSTGATCASNSSVVDTGSAITLTPGDWIVYGYAHSSVSTSVNNLSIKTIVGTMTNPPSSIADAFIFRLLPYEPYAQNEIEYSNSASWPIHVDADTTICFMFNQYNTSSASITAYGKLSAIRVA